jgi:structural maintenance of chromosome 1
MAQEQQLVVKLSNLETRFKSISFELDLSKEKVAKAQTESDTATKQNAKIKTELTKVNKEISAVQKQIDTLTTAVNQIEDQIFAKFSKEVGIENVREYENARLNKSKEDGEARLRFSTQKSRIQQLIAYEGRRDLEKVLNDQVAKVNKEKENLKKEEV